MNEWLINHPLLQVQRSFWDTFFAVCMLLAASMGGVITFTHAPTTPNAVRPSLPLLNPSNLISTPNLLLSHWLPPSPQPPCPPFESPPHISDVFIGSSQSTICTHPYHLIGPFCSLVHMNLPNHDLRVLVSALSVHFIIAFEIQMIFSFSLVDNSWWHHTKWSTSQWSPAREFENANANQFGGCSLFHWIRAEFCSAGGPFWLLTGMVEGSNYRAWNMGVRAACMLLFLAIMIHAFWFDWMNQSILYLRVASLDRLQQQQLVNLIKPTNQLPTDDNRKLK